MAKVRGLFLIRPSGSIAIMRTLFRSSLAGLCALILSACPQTDVPRNFGTGPVTLMAADWQGRWRESTDDDSLLFTVTDAAKGALTILPSDSEAKKEPPIEVLIREAGKTKDGETLAFMLTFEKPGNERGSLNLITVPDKERDKGSFHLWGIQHDVIEKAVQSGELKGEIKSVKEKDDEKPHNHTELAADASNYAKLIDPKYWEWTKPSTFIRQASK